MQKRLFNSISMKILFIGILVGILLIGCSSDSTNIPEPKEIYSAIADVSELTDMVEFTAEELDNIIGIAPQEYSDYAAYQAGSGIDPDEVIIIKAIDSSKADAIAEKLRTRLDHKRKSAELYLTDNLDIINNAVVRKDGNMVTLLIVEKNEAAQTAYNKLVK